MYLETCLPSGYSTWVFSTIVRIQFIYDTVCPPLVLTQMPATLRYFAPSQLYVTALVPRSEVRVLRISPVCKFTRPKVLKVTRWSFLDSISVTRWEWAQVDERVSDPCTCMSRALKAHRLYHNVISETCLKHNVIKRTPYPKGFVQPNEHKANTNTRWAKSRYTVYSV
jgi:hypothetical protein